MTAERLFVVAGICALLAFTFITPPFQVPDEIGHFWRAETIAYGTIVPRMSPTGAVGEVPKDVAGLVQVFWRPTGDVHITRDDFHRARWLRVGGESPVAVRFPAGYTPVPYVPQIAAALIGRFTHAIPLVTFYLGRLLNALAFLALAAIAIRITPVLKWLFTAVALLPMALYLGASWSPDAMTIAASLLFTAGLLRGVRTTGDLAFVAGMGAVVGLCKPAYFLIALLVFGVVVSRGSWRVVILAATALGVVLAMWNAKRAFVEARPGVRIVARAQIECIRSDPSVLRDAIVREARLHGFEYAEQAVGRLGLLDIWLSWPIVPAELLLLLLCAWSGAQAISMRVRLLALLIAIGTIGGIALSSYLGWTAVCARQIDGIQGRYFLPIAPLILAVVSVPLLRRDAIPRIAVTSIAAIANATAIVTLIARYYR
jgi:uncharacterized membrane protein